MTSASADIAPTDAAPIDTAHIDTALIAGLRRFNRTVTQRVGALEDTFLALSRPLGQARLLWEIGPEGSEVRALRARLDLDSGYLSRLLRALEADGLIVVDADDTDGRVRTARLTQAGSAERAELDDRSDNLAASILAPLTTTQRQTLVAAMGKVEQLMTASQVRIAPTDPRHPHARYCISEYFAELARRFEHGFDPKQTNPATDREFTAPAGLFLVAELHGEPVGGAGLKLLRGEAIGEAKRLWISPDVRGLGLGRRLLSELEAHAKKHGMRTLRLDTNRALTEAISLYRSAGYREVEPFNQEAYAHHWFEKTLTEPAG
jgi:DNA-binding MarR family transcriptional regulator/GNAT superfamily N-acetyltransferase